jgi:hypothetical protein
MSEILTQICKGWDNNKAFKDQYTRPEHAEPAAIQELEEKVNQLMSQMQAMARTQEETASALAKVTEEKWEEQETVADLRKRISRIKEDRRREQEEASVTIDKLTTRIDILEKSTARDLRETQRQADTLGTDQKNPAHPRVNQETGGANKAAEQAKPQQLIKLSRRITKDVPSISITAPPSKRVSMVEDSQSPVEVAVSRTPSKNKLRRLKALFPTSTRLFNIEALMRGELLPSTLVNENASFMPSDEAGRTQLKTILASHQGNKTDNNAHAHKLHELMVFPCKDFSILPKGLASAFTTFAEKVRLLLQDSHQWMSSGTVSKVYDIMQVFMRLYALHSTLPVNELKLQELQELQQRNCLYNSTWVTEFEHQHRAICLHVTTLWHTLHQIPVECDLRKDLVACWSAEATRLRKMVDATGSKFGVYIGVSIFPHVMNDEY